MILCVTLNPCLDKTLTVPAWRPGDLVRGTEIREVVGGKGNNVARALARLGRSARPVTFLGGSVGRHCEELLRSEDRLDPIVVTTAAPTRVILTARTADTPQQTAFFDPDPKITDAESEALYAAVQAAVREGGVELITLSGSSPSPATDALYSDLISLVKAHRIPVFLDTYGGALEAIWGFWPDVIQLNRREAAAYLGRSADAVREADLLELLDDWVRHGVQLGVITAGPDEAFAYAQGRYFRCTPPPIEAVNPIGSGDSLLAGLADGWLKALPAEELLKTGVACAVANALTWDAGAIDSEEVARQAETITVEPIDRTPPAAANAGLVRRTLGRKR